MFTSLIWHNIYFIKFNQYKNICKVQIYILIRIWSETREEMVQTMHYAIIAKDSTNFKIGGKFKTKTSGDPSGTWILRPFLLKSQSDSSSWSSPTPKYEAFKKSN